MDIKSTFNATVCIIGIAILLIHTINILLKRDRRKDENSLLIFIVFTIIHFATYLTFTFIKIYYTSDPLIMGFYTTFFIMNNVELLLLFNYTISYIELKKRTKDIISIVNISLFVVFVVLDIINIFTHMFFYSDNGVYTRAKTMFFAQGYQFIAFAAVFVISVFNRKLNITEKIAFAAYCILPLIAIIIQNLLPGYAIAYLSIIIAIEILFLFVNVQKNILLANEAKRTKEAEIKLMMSQIQPHFVYNTLSSISTLITIDPEKAQKALDDFTSYLRMNFSSLTETRLVSFADELKHIKTYVELEKMRFNDRLNVVYDIRTTQFDVPPLSVQPIVENAIKHGILKKIEGGTVTLSVHEEPDSFVVEVIDDGVGFDANNAELKENKHVGLNNVKHRINSMCKGDIVFKSELNKGTEVTITFYK